MSAIYKNGIAYGGAASTANLISATGGDGTATNVQAQLDTINENITSLNDDLSNFDTILQYTGQADLTAPYTDFIATSCTLSAGNYLISGFLQIKNAISNVDYLIRLRNADNDTLTCSTLSRPSGYSPSVNIQTLVKIVSSDTISFTCGANYLSGQTSVGTVTGTMRVLKLK